MRNICFHQANGPQIKTVVMKLKTMLFFMSCTMPGLAFTQTSLFTGSSCGIFPTISASYPIANYPLAGLTVYFDVSFGGWT